MNAYSEPQAFSIIQHMNCLAVKKGSCTRHGDPINATNPLQWTVVDDSGADDPYINYKLMVKQTTPVLCTTHSDRTIETCLRMMAHWK